jgi:hypothetical protein
MGIIIKDMLESPYSASVKFENTYCCLADGYEKKKNEEGIWIIRYTAYIFASKADRDAGKSHIKTHNGVIVNDNSLFDAQQIYKDIKAVYKNYENVF